MAGGATDTGIVLAIAAAWIAVLAPGVRYATGAGRGPRLVFAAALAAAAVVLERRTGMLASPGPLATLAGLGLVLAGVVLHRRARRALGPAFATRVAAPPDGRLVTGGPYAVVRHPIYAAVLLVAAGGLLAHPSAATACLAAGIGAGVAVKIPREEQVLAHALGPTWAAYAARVPALVPRLRRVAR